MPNLQNTIAVTEITGVPKIIILGKSLTLTGTVKPSTATNKTIVWDVDEENSKGTGAKITGNTLRVTAAGTVKVRATIKDGTASGTDFSSVFDIDVFVPVTGITGVPTTTRAKSPLQLTATVIPANATNKTIVWSVENAGTTKAEFPKSAPDTLNTTALGTVRVRATITDGKEPGANYSQVFTIKVNPEFIAVSGITGVATRATAGTPLTLSGTVSPSDATNKVITWSVADAGTTGATITGNTLYTTAAGKVTVKATITNGKLPTGTPSAANYARDFDIKVELPHLPDQLKEVIGKGYDITGKYADSGQIKTDGMKDLPILNLDKLRADGKVVQDMQQNSPLKYGEFESVSGFDINEYMEKYAKKALSEAGTPVGLQGMFKKYATEDVIIFKTPYSGNQERYKRDDFSFATARIIIVKDAYYVTIMNDLDKLREYLDDKFKIDLNGNMEPKALVERYGTHVMLGGVLGGRFEYHMCGQRKYDVKDRMGAYANKKAKILFVDKGTTTSLDNSNKVNYINNVVPPTGTMAYGTDNRTTNRDFAVSTDFDTWKNNVNANKWIDYYPKSLVPIYELTVDAARRNAIRNYFTDTYFKIINIYGSTREEREIIDVGEIKNKTDNFYVTNPRGDADVYTQSGRTTNWKLELKIKTDNLPNNTSTKEYNRIYMEYFYQVSENRHDWTILELRGTKIIDASSFPFLKILCDKESGFSGVISGKEHNYKNVYKRSPNDKKQLIESLDVKIDGSGHDWNNIGFKVTLNFEYLKRI